MMNKQDKINIILAIAAGKTHKVIKARPGLKFTLIDKDHQLFINTKTRERITWLEIQKRYGLGIKGLGQEGFNLMPWCSLVGCPIDSEEVYFTEITLSPIDKDMVVILTEPIEYMKDIIINTDNSITFNQL